MKERLFTFPVITLIFISFVLGVSEFIVVGILTEMADGLNTTASSIGLLVSLFAVAYAIAAPILSHLTARFNRFYVFMTFIIVFLFANLFSMVSWDYGSLAASRMITAAVSGAILAQALTFCNDVATNENKAKTIAWVFSGFSIACILGMPLGTVICHSAGWRTTFVLVIVLSVLMIAMTLMSLPRKSNENAWTQNEGERKEKKNLAIIKDPRIVLTMFFSFFGVGGVYVFYTYVTPVMRNSLGFDDSAVSLGLFAFGAMALISNIASSKLAEKGGYKTLRWIALVQVALFALMTTALTNAITGMIAIMAVGLVTYLMNSTNQMHFMEIAGRWYPWSMSLASSFNPMSFNIGIAMGSAVGGLIMDNLGINYLGYFAAAISLLAFLSAIAIVYIEKNPEKRTSLYE